MTQRIEGKFYPLQHDEWVRACQELTPAQRDVLYFVRTLDPYGEGLDVSIADIARALSTKKKTVHRSTVSRALKELDTKGFIDVELLHVKVTIKAKGVHCCNQTTVLSTDNERDHDATVLSTDNERDHDATVLSTDNERDHDATSVITTQRARSLRNKRQPEALPDKDSASLRSNKTNKTYIDSLSEGEREKFFEFGLKKAAQLPKPPALPEKWIERNFKELHVQFRKEVGEAILPSQEWDHHPRRDDWLLEIRTKGAGAFVGLAPQQERSERVKFREWAQANHQI